MNKQIKWGLGLMMSLALLTFSACEKLVDDAVQTTESAEAATSDMLVLTSLTDGIQDMIDGDLNLQLKNGNFIIPREYLTYTADDSVFTDGDGIRIKFNFEPNGSTFTTIADNPDPGTGALCGDGSTRWGSGIISINKPLDEEGAKLIIELNKYVILKDGMYYVIDDGNAKGREVTMTRESGKWKLKYNLSFYGKGVAETEISPRTYGNGTFYIENLDGGQPGLMDDQITLTGSSDNTNRMGTSYEINITETLIKKGTAICTANTFVEGKMELKNEGSKFEIKADFGDGSCDNDVIITLPGDVKKTITVE